MSLKVIGEKTLKQCMGRQNPGFHVLKCSITPKFITSNTISYSFQLALVINIIISFITELFSPFPLSLVIKFRMICSCTNFLKFLSDFSENILSGFGLLQELFNVFVHYAFIDSTRFLNHQKNHQLGTTLDPRIQWKFYTSSLQNNRKFENQV